ESRVNPMRRGRHAGRYWSVALAALLFVSAAESRADSAHRLADILPGSSSSDPQELTDVGGTLFFTAEDGVDGRKLWKSDGTAAGTVVVKEVLGPSGPHA